MLYRYNCGCVGFAPDGNEKGQVILLACDSEDYGLPSGLNRIVAYRRQMKDPDIRTPLTNEGVQDFLDNLNKLKSLACLGQDFVSLSTRAMTIQKSKIVT
jgi:hypothetical protein